jgi:hypothetical protein
MFAHGLFLPGRTTPTTISLDASAFPYSPDQGATNNVKYQVPYPANYTLTSFLQWSDWDGGGCQLDET